MKTNWRTPAGRIALPTEASAFSAMAGVSVSDFWVYIVGGFLDISMWFARTNVCGRNGPFKGKIFTQICYAYALQQYYLYIISKKLLFCLICSDRFLSSLCCRHICNKGGVQQYFTCKHVEPILKICTQVLGIIYVECYDGFYGHLWRTLQHWRLWTINPKLKFCSEMDFFLRDNYWASWNFV